MNRIIHKAGLYDAISLTSLNETEVGNIIGGLLEVGINPEKCEFFEIETSDINRIIRESTFNRKAIDAIGRYLYETNDSESQGQLRDWYNAEQADLNVKGINPYEALVAKEIQEKKTESDFYYNQGKEKEAEFKLEKEAKKSPERVTAWKKFEKRGIKAAISDIIWFISTVSYTKGEYSDKFWFLFCYVLFSVWATGITIGSGISLLKYLKIRGIETVQEIGDNVKESFREFRGK